MKLMPARVDRSALFLIGRQRELTCQLLECLQDYTCSDTKTVFALAASEAIKVACRSQGPFMVNIGENFVVFLEDGLAVNGFRDKYYLMLYSSDENIRVFRR